MKNLIFLLVVLVGISQGWEVKLSPNPETVSIGQRPTGTPIAIMCIISGLPEDARPKITWTKIQTEGSNENTVTIDHVNIKNLDPFTTSLVIQNGSLDDNGVYICKASFNGENKEVNIDINFFEELYFEDNSTEIDAPQEGISVNLSCRVRQTYQAELVTMWEKGIVALTPKSERNYTFFSNGQVLQINNYSRSLDEGVYHCKVFDRRTGSMISKQIKIGALTKKRQHFCMHLCTNLCHSLYVKPFEHGTSLRRT